MARKYDPRTKRYYEADKNHPDYKPPANTQFDDLPTADLFSGQPDDFNINVNAGKSDLYTTGATGANVFSNHTIPHHEQDIPPSAPTYIQTTGTAPSKETLMEEIDKRESTPMAPTVVQVVTDAIEKMEKKCDERLAAMEAKYAHMGIPNPTMDDRFLNEIKMNHIKQEREEIKEAQDALASGYSASGSYVPDSSSNMKYHEQETLEELQAYLQSTYGEHYKQDDDDLQCFDAWISLGESSKTFRNTAIKYLWRYGTKDGNNKKDLMKAMHYITMMMHVDHHSKGQ